MVGEVREREGEDLEGRRLREGGGQEDWLGGGAPLLWGGRGRARDPGPAGRTAQQGRRGCGTARRYQGAENGVRVSPQCRYCRLLSCL